MAGDSVQLLKTAEYLKEKGLFVTINDGTILDYTEYDIIHLFNLTRLSETYKYFKIAQKFNKLIVLTPIYWDISKFYKYVNDIQNIKQWEYEKQFRQEIIKGCTLIYPSSMLEMEALELDNENNFPYEIIYSGVSENNITASESLEMSQKINSVKPYILCAARVCPRKNQLLLCQMANELDINVILAGTTNSKQYLKNCLTLPNVHYWGFANYNQLRYLYQNAELHILCSFVETPGLSSLEAGYFGTKIISTLEGSAVEYFKNMAVYCNPYDRYDIKNSISTSLTQKNNPGLKKHIEANFLWENCLSKLYKSYFNLL